jgi:hypothetical protein
MSPSLSPRYSCLSAEDYFGSAYISKVSRRRALEEHGCYRTRYCLRVAAVLTLLLKAMKTGLLG